MLGGYQLKKHPVAFEHLSLHLQRHLRQSVVVCDIRNATCNSDAVIIICQVIVLVRPRIQHNCDY